jgi:hypothetical protein
MHHVLLHAAKRRAIDHEAARMPLGKYGILGEEEYIPKGKPKIAAAR